MTLRMVPRSDTDDFKFSELKFDKFVEHTFEPLLTNNDDMHETEVTVDDTLSDSSGEELM